MGKADSPLQPPPCWAAERRAVQRGQSSGSRPPRDARRLLPLGLPRWPGAFQVMSDRTSVPSSQPSWLEPCNAIPFHILMSQNEGRIASGCAPLIASPPAPLSSSVPVYVALLLSLSLFHPHLSICFPLLFFLRSMRACLVMCKGN
jgi:hypothetical protein